ncbi:MAG TPA: hypothetical protein VNO70_02870, partial [Blastocatellia bacterium]|nr:hypothetical protein [Blastocatellia bacterium]
FNLLATAPAGWTATFANPALTLSPGASGSTTLQLISLSSATLGNYAIQVTAANGATPGYQATTSATYAVGSLSTLLATDRLSYTRNQSVAITAVVTSGGSPAAGASVSFATTKPNGAVVRQSATTGADGRATVKLRLKQQDPAGTYRTDAVVSKNGMSASAVTSFVVR